jgi:hypothetical protein
VSKFTAEIADQLRMLGAPADVVAKAEAPQQPVNHDFHVWEDNWEVVCVFIDLATQWQVISGMGGVAYQGVNYLALEAVLRLRQIEPVLWPDLFQGIRIMERAALPLLNESKS